MRPILLILLFFGIQTSTSSQDHREFLSWYNGWTVHTVWGIGKVSGSYHGTSIQCGSSFIPVRAVYDTHLDKEPPTVNQSSEQVAAANIVLLRAIQSDGTKCAFLLIKQ